MGSDRNPQDDAGVPDLDLDIPKGQSVPLRPSRRHQVLALSGGGYRGLYSATFLQHAETHFSAPVGKHFDLLAGTSIGALMAAALAFDVPATMIAEKIIEHGPKIFPRRRMLTWTKRTFFRAPYSSETLKEAVTDTIGSENANRSMKTVEKPLLIVALNYTNGSPEVFRSRGLAGLKASDATVLEAVLSSAAAPTYFPPQVVNNETLIDGGVIANGPELLAACEGCGELGWHPDDIYILAVGTASRRQGAALAPIGRPSAFSWMVRRSLFQSTLAAQEVLAASQCRTLFGQRYYRIDREPSEKQVPAIREFDLTSVAAKNTLESLANASWEEHRSNALFRNFFV